MNWTKIIPASIRSTLYVVFGVLSLGITAVTAWCGAVGDTVPAWVAGATAVLGVVGGAFGFTAAGNTNVDGLDEIIDPDDIDPHAEYVGEDYPDVVDPDVLDDAPTGRHAA